MRAKAQVVGLEASLGTQEPIKGDPQASSQEAISLTQMLACSATKMVETTTLVRILVLLALTKLNQTLKAARTVGEWEAIRLATQQAATSQAAGECSETRPPEACLATIRALAILQVT
jgi:hypothetical protein